MKAKYILALDQGTSSSRALLFDKEANPKFVDQREFKQIFPKPGWVEHNPEEIWKTQIATARAVIKKAKTSAINIAAIGITNQRETTILWNRKTGKPIYNAIVWQDRRTADYCLKLKANKKISDYIRSSTGLVIDAYFSASKIAWLLNNVKGARQLAEQGNLLFGTVDSWLIWKLTNGALHVTDYSNASRTMLFNIKSLKWDDKLLKLFNIPRSILPKVVNSSEVIGVSSKKILGASVAISGIAGDQQAALFGQGCLNPGQAKNTYGTGCFMLMQTGAKAVASKHGLLTTIAWGINGKVSYALEGSVFIAGAAVQWLRDSLQIINDSKEVEKIIAKTPDSKGVVVVPAFAGLGCPYWEMNVRGAIFGLTRGSGKNEIIRATIESIALQSADLLDIMQKDSRRKLKTLAVDGGAAKNNFLMQLQANLLNVDVIRPANTEITALGAALLAGQAVNFYKNTSVGKIFADKRIFKPLSNKSSIKLRNNWRIAINSLKSLHFK